MKAIVVEIVNGNAIVLNKKGDFIKIVDKGFSVGSETDYAIDTPKRDGFSFIRFSKMAAVAAAFILVAGLGLGAYSYSRPYNYVDIDINPSIEITTNIFNRIIEVKGLNADGEKVLRSEHINNKKLEDGIEVILSSAIQKGYLKKETTNAVMFTVSSKNEKKLENLEKDITASVTKELKDAKVNTDILVENVSIERHNEAEKIGISPGKLLLIQRLQKLKPDINIDEHKKTTVKEILKQIKEAKKEKTSETDVKQQEQQGSNEPRAGKNNKNNKNEKNDTKNEDKLKNNKSENESDIGINDEGKKDNIDNSNVNNIGERKNKGDSKDKGNKVKSKGNKKKINENKNVNYNTQ